MRRAILLFAIATILGLMLVRAQFLVTPMDVQVTRHSQVLKGRAPNPWRYRVLSEWVVHGAIRFSRDVLHVKDPYVTGFYAVRVVQNIAIFILAAAYYRRLGLSDARILLALSCLAWAMTEVFFNSDLSFNSYGDMIVYLIAGLLILSGVYWAIMPLSIIGALNRETSILVPVLLGSTALIAPRIARRRITFVAAVTLVLFVAILAYLRWYLGDGGPHTASGSALGWDALRDNVFNPRTWWRLVATLTLLPVLVVMGYRHWPRELRLFAWTLLPVWTITHFLIATPAETRHFLVPLVLILIPGAMFADGPATGITPTGRERLAP